MFPKSNQPSFVMSQKLRQTFHPITAFFFVLALSAIFAFVSVPWRRALQLLAWTVIFLLPLLFVVRQDSIRKLLVPIIGIGLLISYADLGIRGFLRNTFEANPSSSFVVESLVNTTAQESGEFFQSYWLEVLSWSATTAFFLILAWFVILRWGRTRGISDTYPKLRWFLGLFFSIVVIVSWVIRPWRAHLPPVEWRKVALHIEAVKKDWSSFQEELENEGRVAQENIKALESKAETIVLVIGESMNRDNMSLYGYSRKTTPLLEDAVKIKQMRFIPESWSVDSSTVAAFQSMFTFPMGTGNDSKGNLFAFFKHAGWNIVWISNQDDLAIKSEYASWSNSSNFLNHTSGRSTSFLDEKVLAPLEETLQNSHGKTLIVVHLLGIHPSYSLRAPSGQKISWNQDSDEVAKHLNDTKKSLRVKIARNQYDRAMAYQDQIIYSTLELTEKNSQNKPVMWAYLSDHGNETGDTLDRTGHSSGTLSGYKVPFLFWMSKDYMHSFAPTLKTPREFRTDWLSSFLLDAAGIQINHATPTHSILNNDYGYQEPKVITDLKNGKK